MSDELALGIRSQRQPFLPQELPRLVQDLMTSRLGQSSSFLHRTPPRGRRAGCPVVVLPLAPAASLSVQSGLASAMP